MYGGKDEGLSLLDVRRKKKQKQFFCNFKLPRTDKKL